MAVLRLCHFAISAACSSGSVGRPAAATNSGVRRLAIRSLPPPILRRRPYSSTDHSTGRPNSTEGLVEGRQVAVALGVGEDAVAVEDERAHVQALPSLPKSRMWCFAISMTAARWTAKSLGGS